MLKISKAALLAAMLGLSAPAAIGILPAAAQETPAAPFAFEIKVPSVLAVGSSMSEDQIKDIFTSNFLTHADELAGLTATSITIPEISLNFEMSSSPAGKASATYRDIVLTNIRDGFVEKITVGSGTASSTGDTTTYGAMSVDGFDIRRTFELIGLVKGDPSAPMKPIYAGSTSGATAQSGPLYSCNFDGSSSAAMEARPAKFSVADVIAVIEKFKGAGEPPPEAISTIVSYVADVVRAFRGGAGSIGAIACDIPGGGNPVKLTIAGVTTNGFEPGIYPDVKVGALAVDAGPMGKASLGEFALKPIDFNPPLNALDAAAGQLSEAWFDANWRLLIPSWGGFSFANFALDAVNPEMGNQRVQAKVGSFDLSLGNYLLGIPTDVSLSAVGIEVPLPQDTTDPQLQTLLAAGLTGVNMGVDVAAAWDEAAKTIEVEKLAIAAVDLGSMAISATIGNATEQLFAIDPNVSMASSFALTVKEVTINVTDDGLGKIVWPLAAAEQGKTDVEAFRGEMASLAEGVAIQLIGRTDAARQLGVAIGDFIVGGKSEITINIKAKDPNGIPMAMFIAAQNDPSILAGQVEITGLAN